MSRVVCSLLDQVNAERTLTFWFVLDARECAFHFASHLPLCV